MTPSEADQYAAAIEGSISLTSNVDQILLPCYNEKMSCGVVSAFSCCLRKWRGLSVRIFITVLAWLLSLNASAGALARPLFEFQAWGIASAQGPQSARGIIYFVNGYGPTDVSVDAWRLAPYFLRSLNKDGWDVIVAKVPYHKPVKPGPAGRAALEEAFKDSVASIKKRLPQLKQQGYKTVVAGGHSFGGWAALNAISANPSLADRLILSAPSMHGRRHNRNKKRNPRHKNLTGESGKLFATLRVPAFAMFFNGDDYEPDGRSEAVAGSARVGSGHFLVNKPKEFNNHFAGWTPAFDFIYENCFRYFLSGVPTAGCERSAFNTVDPRSITQFRDATGFETVTAADLVGHAFVRYGLGTRNMHVRISTETQMVASTFEGSRSKPYQISSDASMGLTRVCIDSECTAIAKCGVTELCEFRPDTKALTYFWVRE